MNHCSECKTCNGDGETSPHECLLLELGYSLIHWDIVKNEVTGEVEFFHKMTEERWPQMGRFQDVETFIHEFHWHFVKSPNDLKDYLSCSGCQEQFPFGRSTALASHIRHNKCGQVPSSENVQHAYVRACGVSDLSEWEMYPAQVAGGRMSVICNKVDDRVCVGSVLDVVRGSVVRLEWKKKCERIEEKRMKEKRDNQEAKRAKKEGGALVRRDKEDAKRANKAAIALAYANHRKSLQTSGAGSSVGAGAMSNRRMKKSTTKRKRRNNTGVKKIKKMKKKSQKNVDKNILSNQIVIVLKDKNASKSIVIKNVPVDQQNVLMDIIAEEMREQFGTRYVNPIK